MAPDLSNFVWILALNPPLDRPSAEAKEDPVRSVPAPLWIIFDSENGPIHMARETESAARFNRHEGGRDMNPFSKTLLNSNRRDAKRGP